MVSDQYSQSVVVVSTHSQYSRSVFMVSGQYSWSVLAVSPHSQWSVLAVSTRGQYSRSVLAVSTRGQYSLEGLPELLLLLALVAAADESEAVAPPHHPAELVEVDAAVSCGETRRRSTRDLGGGETSGGGETGRNRGTVMRRGSSKPCRPTRVGKTTSAHEMHVRTARAGCSFCSSESSLHRGAFREENEDAHVTHQGARRGTHRPGPPW